MLCISAWIAIDAVGPHNGCVEVIPGSHRWQLTHVASSGTGRFGLRAEPTELDVSSAVPIELEPGQFFLFDRWLVHRSPVNRSNAPRIGLSARFTTPAVRVDCKRLVARTPAYGVQLVRGSDHFGYNRSAPIPEAPPSG
jgi:ectoine hydroxylase-related dioxygenase (phytanoyl-CoA dioxygenase family)